MNKVSVVMITYGHEKYISSAIKGVFMQRYAGEIELIIANDNSPDNTDIIVKELIKNTPAHINVKYTCHKNNIGMMPNFFWALNQADGDYIALCEGDDYWIDPLKLEKQVAFLKHNLEYGLTFTDVNFINESDGSEKRDVFKNKILPFYNDPKEFLIRKLYYAPCTWLGKREIFNVENQDKDIADGTFAMMIEILAKTKVHLIPDTTANYRLLDESASRTKDLLKALKREIGLFNTQKYYMIKYDFVDIFDKVNQSGVNSIAYLIGKNNNHPQLLNTLKEIVKSPDLSIIHNQLKKWIYISLTPYNISFFNRIKITFILGWSKMSRRALLKFLFKDFL